MLRARHMIDDHGHIWIRISQEEEIPLVVSCVVYHCDFVAAVVLPRKAREALPEVTCYTIGVICSTGGLLGEAGPWGNLAVKVNIICHTSKKVSMQLTCKRHCSATATQS